MAVHHRVQALLPLFEARISHRLTVCLTRSGSANTPAQPG
jgi:hypothetical protein